jgi:2,4-dienoyl-CoA reductase-like NADH-dependent reductase (Old Yellow Enzyme family)
VKVLSHLALDMVVLSGGSYEARAMQGRTGEQRALATEAYFFEFAAQIAKEASIPVMTT